MELLFELGTTVFSLAGMYYLGYASGQRKTRSLNLPIGYLPVLKNTARRGNKL